MNRVEPTFWDVVAEVRKQDARYRREAYGFIVASISLAVWGLPPSRREDPERRHLSGGEVAASTARLARSEFGDLAAVVLGEWGIADSRDIGRIVFQLVERGQLAARPGDRLEDFEIEPDPIAALRAGAR